MKGQKNPFAVTQLASAKFFEVGIGEFGEDVVRHALVREGLEEMLEMGCFQRGFESDVHRRKKITGCVRGGNR
jgi:hypothetical protein